jgi:hypothetical protein
MLVGGALIGCGIAVYLALYQLGVLTSVWEPFFGSGSRDVLHSKIAQSLSALDEVVASLQFLRREYRLGASRRDALWGRGGHHNNTTVSE